MARCAREVIRTSFYKVLIGARKEKRGSFDERAIAVCFAVKGGSSRHWYSIRFFDWETTRQDEDPLVYRLERGDNSDFRIITVPRRSSDPGSEPSAGGSSEGEEEVEVVVKVAFMFGSVMRSIYFTTSFSQALYEGKLCGCCRFHDVFTDHTKTCMVHGDELPWDNL